MGDETFADFFRPSQTSSVANDLMEEWEEEVAALKLSNGKAACVIKAASSPW